MNEDFVRVLNIDDIDKSSIVFAPQGRDYTHEIHFMYEGGTEYRIRGWKAIYSFINTLFPNDPIPKRNIKNTALSGDTYFAEDIRSFLDETSVSTIMLYGEVINKDKYFTISNVTTYSSLIDEYFIRALMAQCKEVMQSSTYTYPYDISIVNQSVKYKSGIRLVPTVRLAVLKKSELLIRLFKNRIEITTRVILCDGYSYARTPRNIISGDDLNYGTFSSLVRNQIDYLLDAIFKVRMNATYTGHFICTKDETLTEREREDLEIDNYKKFSILINSINSKGGGKN